MRIASVIMIAGALMLAGLFVFPLWNIQLGAPQYPDPLGIDIYIDGLKGQSEFDIQNIDGLNHYIGMKTLPKPGDMWEFEYFPIIVLSMVILGVIVGLLGFLRKLGPGWFLGWFLLMSVLGVLGMYDFNLWMIDYGTNLDPHAIMKLQNPDGTPMSYKPPLLGHRKLLNFDAYSYPGLGGYMTGASLFLALLAFIVGRKRKLKVGAVGLLLFFMAAGGCSQGPEDIAYGSDQCEYCRMTIVDKIHGAELINDKGKIFKYDAVECMINDLADFDQGEPSEFMVNHHDEPSRLIKAESAYYIISKNLPSPMGAYLTAFPSKKSAQKGLEVYGGEIYSWEELLNKEGF